MHNLYKFVAAVTLLPVNILLADPLPTTAEKISLWQLFIPLAIVLAAIFLLAWLVKKFGKKIPMLNSDIKICSMAAISNNAKLVLIDIKGNSLLVGVTSQNVNLIKDFTSQIKLPTTPADPNIKKQFSDYIQQENKSSVETSD